MYDKKYQGNVNFIEVYNGETSASFRPLFEQGLDIVLNNSSYYELIKKVTEANFVPLTTLTKGRNAFGIVGRNIEDISSVEKYAGAVEIRCAHEQIRYIDRTKITRNIDVFEKYKVFISKGNGGAGLLSDDKQVSILGKAYVGAPFTACTDSLIPIGCFDTQEEAENLQKYLATKFLRFLAGILKVSQNIYQNVYEVVPVQDFTLNSDINWKTSIREIDEQLYTKYKLTSQEIEMIEKKINPMEYISSTQQIA